jgi:uncharacterized SAM-binding protein YcdF (DUF218 family)
VNASSQTKSWTGRLLNRRFVRVLLFFLLLWPLLAWFAARGLIVHKDLPRADAIVVLGGSATYIERARIAAKLFHEGRASKILLTNDGLQGGWSNEEQRNPFFVERAKKELLNQGVSEEAIEILSPIVGSTRDEALLLRERLPERNIASVLIVTSPYHTRRALRTIGRALSDKKIEVGIVSPQTGEQSPKPFFWWLSFSGWSMVAGEYMKLVWHLLNSGF